MPILVVNGRYPFFSIGYTALIFGIFNFNLCDIKKILKEFVLYEISDSETVRVNNPLLKL